MPLYVTVDEDADAARAFSVRAGFVADRREGVYLVPTHPDVTRLQGVRPPTEVSLVSAAAVDLDRLRLLDDELREDVPGTDGWRWTDAEFRRETFSSELDPTTYLVAVDIPTGDYVGIARVWMRPERPRLGFIGVRRSARRHGIAKALRARVFGVLHDRGVRDVSTEIDDTNVAARSLIEPLGARRIGGTVELVRSPR